MNSDYLNSPIDNKGTALSSGKNRDLMLKVVEIMENGITHLNKEQVEDAYREFKVAE